MRKVIQTRAEIGVDRVLHVPVPPDIPGGQVDVTVVVETAPDSVDRFLAERALDEERREKVLARAGWAREAMADVLEAFAAFNAPYRRSMTEQAAAVDAGAGMLRHLDISTEELRAERQADTERTDRKYGL